MAKLAKTILEFQALIQIGISRWSIFLWGRGFTIFRFPNISGVQKSSEKKKKQESSKREFKQTKTNNTSMYVLYHLSFRKHCINISSGLDRMGSKSLECSQIDVYIDYFVLISKLLLLFVNLFFSKCDNYLDALTQSKV